MVDCVDIRDDSLFLDQRLWLSPLNIIYGEHNTGKTHILNHIIKRLPNESSIRRIEPRIDEIKHFSRFFERSQSTEGCPTSTGRNLFSYLWKVLNDPEQKKTADEIKLSMTKINATLNVDDFAVETNNDGNQQIFYRGPSISDDSYHYLLVVSWLTHPSPPDLLIFDGLGNNLHASVHRHINQLATKAATKTQIIATTNNFHFAQCFNRHTDIICIEDLKPQR